MMSHRLNHAVIVLAFGYAVLAPSKLLAQGEGSGTTGSFSGAAGEAGIVQPIDLEVSINRPDGTPFDGMAVVTITKLNGEDPKVETAKAGRLKLNGVPQGEYSIQVVAPGFGEVTKNIDTRAQSTMLMKVIVQLEPVAEGEGDAGADPRVLLLAPNAQQAIGKAFEALGAKMTEGARRHLETAYRLAPNDAEVNYLFGVYSMQTYKREKAKAYWTKTLELYPQHYRALICLGQALVDENKPGEALPYLERAVKAEPSSWRAHAIYTDAYLRQGFPDEAIKHAELALELEPAQAAIVQRYLAAAFAKLGETSKAISALQTYLREHHSDEEAKRQLERLRSNAPQNGRSAGEIPSQEMVEPWALDEVTALPLPATWLPANIDKRVPPVERRASCRLDEVVKHAGLRIEEFVGNVDRFTATEFVTHESINKWGVASSPEKRKFDYLVSVAEVRPGSLSVDEYRSSGKQSAVEFPGGVETRGLPALVLIFHPYNAGSFEMSCEGLSQWHGKPAWQVHFRQRSDKPNQIRAYRMGLTGPSYPIALKGRAWIAADTFRITRLETDLIAPVPEILLFADHTAIEYGPVHFKNRKVEMWLPQTAEVYYDWRGRRTHRRHSFSNYLLFSVDDKQKISDPKAAQESPPGPSTGPGTAQP